MLQRLRLCGAARAGAGVVVVVAVDPAPLPAMLLNRVADTAGVKGVATPLPGVALVPGVGAAGVAGGAGVVPLVATAVDDGVAAAVAAVVVVVTDPVAAGEAARDSRPPWSLRQANTRSNASSLVRVA